MSKVRHAYFLCGMMAALSLSEVQAMNPLLRTVKGTASRAAHFLSRRPIARAFPVPVFAGDSRSIHRGAPALDVEVFKTSFRGGKLKTVLDRPSGSVVDGYATVKLKELIIYETQTKDSLGKEEGTATFGINDQSATLYWSGDTHEGKETVRYRPDMLLFAGSLDGKSWLDFSAAMVEIDGKSADRWETAGNVLSQFSKLGGVIPGYGSAVSGGFSLIGKLAEFIASLIDDDQEFAYFGALNDPSSSGIKAGTYKLKVMEGSKTNITASIEVARHEPEGVFSTDDQVRVILESIMLPERLKDKAEKGSVVLEFNTSGQGTKRTFLGNVFEHGVLDIGNIKLYEGPWRELMPVTSSLITTQGSTGFQFEQLQALYSETASLVQSLAPNTEVDDTVFAVGETVTSAIVAGIGAPKEDMTFALGKGLIRGKSGSETFALDVYDPEKRDYLGQAVMTLKTHKIGKVPTNRNPQNKLEVVVLNEDQYPVPVKNM